jgi:ribosomal protein L34
MDFHGSFERMKPPGFRKQAKSFGYLLRAKSADARAIVTDPKNGGPIKVEDTIAALQYSHANKLAFTQKSECSIDRRA